ncbi:VWA domain-containing protein [uncultured Lamprocystis sp.]|uniref:nitric oxide reductase activation protein NorD n=1 Tax=uncultured Lamprocystis sp. TaxID=543132 RepID=UPI0025DF4F36|nr:VWA domain-containing protein [uncultured Lamprocystis sp.]
MSDDKTIGEELSQEEFLARVRTARMSDVLRALPDAEIPDWVIDLLAIYDHQGSQGGIRALRRVADDALTRRAGRDGQRFADLAQVLDAFTTGLAGRRLRLAVGDTAYTDTETLFVPAAITRFASRAENFRLYKCLIAFLWAQNWFGTWREPALGQLAPYADRQRALALFAALEGLRLDARIRAELPGLARDMDRLGARPPLPPDWQDAAACLRAADADAAHSWTLTAELYRAGIAPLEPLCYQGELQPERVAEVVAARSARERDQFVAALAVIAAELANRPGVAAGEPPRFHLEREQTDRLFQRRRKLDRNVAVLFMVDMSGSTKGWINEVCRESLVLLCEALELLGDRYAIYGFSGYTHMRCEAFPVKTFAEPYDTAVQDRISGIRPQDYTRMGVTIRHLTRKLLAVDARTRVLLTISDGRPDDEDGYRGDYGIADTRQAILEARSQGVHPFCITVDDQAQDYLPHMFGPAGYTLVEKVAKLPYRVADIYRRMTG